MSSRLAALVVLTAALACADADSATLLAPPSGTSDVTIEAAPAEGTFTVRVFYPRETCGTELFATGDPSTFTLPVGADSYCIKVQATSPSDAEGTVVLSACSLPRGQTNGGTTKTPSASCTEQGGKGRWLRIESLSGTGEWDFFHNEPLIVTLGWRVQYRGMGSGVKNTTLPVFDVVRPNE